MRMKCLVYGLCIILALGIAPRVATGTLPVHEDVSTTHRELKSVSSAKPVFCPSEKYALVIMDLAVRGQYHKLNAVRALLIERGVCIVLLESPEEGSRAIAFSIASVTESVPVYFQLVQTVATGVSSDSTIVVMVPGLIVCWISAEERRCL